MSRDKHFQAFYQIELSEVHFTVSINVWRKKKEIAKHMGSVRALNKNERKTLRCTLKQTLRCVTIVAK